MTNNNSNKNSRLGPADGRMEPPGRNRHDDSINASSEDLGGDRDGHEYSAGYDSHMATRIGDEEDRDDRVDRFRELHEGRHSSDGSHSVRESYRDKKRIAQAICSALPLTNPECALVVNTVENIDMSLFGNQKGITRVTLGIVAVLIDERGRDSPQCLEDLVSRSDKFRSLRERHEISMSDLTTVKGIVRGALDGGGVDFKPSWSTRDPALPGPTSPNELPEEYWEAKSPEYWANVAKGWQYEPDEWKESIPKEYRSLIDRLRHWEPWKIIAKRSAEKIEAEAAELVAEIEADRD